MKNIKRNIFEGSGKKAGTVFDKYDMFAVPVNSFHLEGQA
jgi:hypothetical protein